MMRGAYGPYGPAKAQVEALREEELRAKAVRTRGRPRVPSARLSRVRAFASGGRGKRLPARARRTERAGQHAVVRASPLLLGVPLLPLTHSNRRATQARE